MQTPKRSVDATGGNVAVAVSNDVVAKSSVAATREFRHVVASFDEIARNQRGQLISTIGAALRDAGLSAGTLSVGMGALAAIMAGIGIVHGAESLGKMATETQAASAAAGMSIEQFSRIQGAMSLMGLKTDEANTALRSVCRACWRSSY